MIMMTFIVVIIIVLGTAITEVDSPSQVDSFFRSSSFSAMNWLAVPSSIISLYFASPTSSSSLPPSKIPNTIQPLTKIQMKNIFVYLSYFSILQIVSLLCCTYYSCLSKRSLISLSFYHCLCTCE